MKKYMIKNKKTSLMTALALLASLAFAQEADDGFIVPLNEDFSKAVASSPAPAAGNESRSKVRQGAWIEVTSSNKSIIRDIATGKKKGYEFDNSHFKTNMNWWFWGEINPYFQLDAEIAVWNVDKTLYQANSYADNVPDVTWGDGFQSLASIPFSFIYNLNDNGIGAFNKLGFTITNPYANVKFGYGKLKANGMLDFDGIYHVIDRWDYVDKGFTEVSLGKNLQKFGEITVNATAALSMMRGTYGLYDLLDVKYGDEKNPLLETALTFGSYTTKEELFRYNEQNISAASAYIAVNPIEPLKFELHGMGTFGSDVDFDRDALALAGRIGWKSEKFSVRLMESYAAKNVNSVWGSDGTDYDDINANTATTQLDFSVTPKSAFTLGLDQGVTLVLDTEDEASKHDQYSGFLSFRSQPYADFDLSSLLGKDISLGLYGILFIDRLTEETKTDKDIEPFFRGAGLEIKANDTIPHIKKLTFDYAFSANASWEMEAGKIDSNNSYDLGESFHSLMLTADINDRLSLTAAGLYRNYSADLKSSFVEQPLGVALGFSVNKVPLPGRPKFWMHFTYGMDPYEDKNYTLFRADDPQNKAPHRTYLLNTLDDTVSDDNTASYLRLGLIWDL
ncbi:MAG: hypothetical protein IJ257_04140 [Treponema sp.]|nr:hypothetical protein [Treponema sp.]